MVMQGGLVIVWSKIADYSMKHDNEAELILGMCQPMRDVVTLYRRLSLAGRKPRISPMRNTAYKSDFKLTKDTVSPRAFIVSILRKYYSYDTVQLTHWSLGDVEVILQMKFSNSFYELIISWTL